MVRGTFTRRSTLSALAGAIGGGVVVGGAGGGKQEEGGKEGANGKGSGAAINIKDQYTDGQSVVVEKAVLPTGGFIDIHDPLRAGGVYPPLGAALGATDFLEPGTYEELEIPLFQDVPCVDFDRTRLFESQHVMAMPHRDSNNNKKFDHWCTMKEKEGIEDGGFGPNFPNLVKDMAYVAVRQAEQVKAGDIAHDKGGKMNETEGAGMNMTQDGGMNETECGD